jgi:ferredoxin
MWIDPLLCTECLLFADEPQCQQACPHGAIFRARGDQTERAIHPLLRKKSQIKESSK